MTTNASKCKDFTDLRFSIRSVLLTRCVIYSCWFLRCGSWLRRNRRFNTMILFCVLRRWFRQMRTRSCFRLSSSRRSTDFINLRWFWRCWLWLSVNSGLVHMRWLCLWLNIEIIFKWPRLTNWPYNDVVYIIGIRNDITWLVLLSISLIDFSRHS